MTDYFHPASWEGIATLWVAGHTAVAAVGIGQCTHGSGREIIKTREVDLGPCVSCFGSGRDPSGWTLQTAREEPERFNRETGPAGSISLVPHVVSPRLFGDGGYLKCRKCHGTGRSLDYEQVVTDHFPTYQATPGRCGWHVEFGGKIVAKGTGRFLACSRYEGGEAVAEAVAAKIDAAARKG